ncbi:MAG: hypothetical protein LBK26_01460 [Rickettsiales bacterium]|jgi:hypothetical protein|nr:hypothetical protein [Rickettsiales bacterium]
MRKLYLIFAAVMFAGAFLHAHADDRTFESMLDAARAAVRTSPMAAPFASAAVRGNQAAAMGVPSETLANGGPASRIERAAPKVADATERSAAPVAREVLNRAAATLKSARTASPAAEPRIIGSRANSRETSPAISEESGRNRAAATTQSRAGIISKAAPQIPKAETNQIKGQRIGGRISAARAATTSAAAETAGGVDYKACRETFFQCMDEFCANKNAQLQRCACSSRMHEFDKQNKQLDKFSDKMMDFSENLLAVSMDKEDAAAMIKATEGEDAFTQTKDKSQSQQMLDGIMKKLKATTTDESTNRSLAAINLSMDYGDAFDTVDMTLGSAATAKEGVALYNAALPICRDIAKEVCAPADIKTVTSAYQMTIEQDCNTVAKTYVALADAAKEKVFEAGALLDMSRLNDQQTRNSDDILACKKKMIDMLSNNTVCGTDLEKCLDWSGKYIDPATGGAILTPDLANLANTITPPADGGLWAKTPGNERFVSFLNAKKKYLEPAMANCEQVSVKVWELFLEDALAQIRLSQTRKLEDMRQGCTLLTAECITGTAQSFTDFDARALSVFGISADTAVNKMCADIKNSCTALMQGTGGEYEWTEAMTDIAVKKTYEQILITCAEVGKSCIVQNCNNYASKFGLCTKAEDTVRKNIINQRLCWKEVVACVQQTSSDTLTKIITSTGDFGRNIETGFPGAGNKPSTMENLPYSYNGLVEYYNGTTPAKAIYIMTTDALSVDESSVPIAKDSVLIYPQWPRQLINHKTAAAAATGIWLSCPSGLIDNRVCRIAEKIWGNCNGNPMSDNTAATILGTKNQYTDTLLAWLNQNTSNDACLGSECPPGMDKPKSPQGMPCMPADQTTSDGEYCPANMYTTFYVLDPVIGDSDGWSNCCQTNKQDAFGNCCSDGGLVTVPVDVTKQIASGTGSFRMLAQTTSPTGETSQLCIPSGSSVKYIAKYNYNDKGTEYLFCLGTISGGEGGTPENATCNGKFFIVNTKTGFYSVPLQGYVADSGKSITNDGQKFTVYNYGEFDGTNKRLCAPTFNWTTETNSGKWDQNYISPNMECPVGTPFTKTGTGNVPPRWFVKKD